jgi:hypothetical protein
VDRFGLDQAHPAPDQGVVQRVADGADAGCGAGGSQSFGEGNGGVLRGVNWSSQHLEREVAQLRGLLAGHARAGAGVDLGRRTHVRTVSVVPIPSFWATDRIASDSRRDRCGNRPPAAPPATATPRVLPVASCHDSILLKDWSEVTPVG